MALKVWLPLNGNLENKGTSGLNFSMTGTENFVLEDSKTGSGYEHTSISSGYIASDAPIDLGNQLSMFCWVKPAKFNSDADLTGLFGQHRHSNSTGMGINLARISNTTGHLTLSTGDGTNRTFTTYQGKTLLSANKWYHVGFTYDGAKIRLYVNGALDGEVDYTTQKNVSDYLVLYSWSLSGKTGNISYNNYALLGKLNDVRIYDECLSVAQIREISKGLVAHYRLGGPGANLLPSDGLVKSGATSLTYDKFTHTYTIVSPAGSGNWGNGVNINENKNILIPYGEEYRISFYVLVPTAHTIKIDYNNASADSTVASWGGNDNDLTGSRLGASFSVPANQWTQIVVGSKNAHANNTSQVAIKECSKIGLYTTDDTEETTWYIRDIKFELGNKVTTWTPYIEDWGYLDNEPDCSGNQYDLIPSALKPEMRGESIRYSGSFLFHGKNTQYLYRDKFAWLKPPFTFNCWCNQISRTSQKGSSGTTTLQFIESQGRDCGLAGFSLVLGNGVPRVYLGTETSGTYHVINSDTALALNTWHMLTGTYDGTTVKLYVDGVLKSSKAVSTTISWSEADGFTIGKMAYRHTTTTDYFPFNGYINDARVYATALSADDISKLYHQGAYIDDKGHIGAYEFVEEV